MNHKLLSLSRAPLFAAGLALLTACVSEPRGSYNTISGSENSGESTRFSPNRDLENSLETHNIIKVRKDSMLIIQFELVNKLDRALSFQWGIEWYDRAGLVLDYGPGHYSPERLSARQSKTIKIVAPSPDAESWKLQVGSRDEAR